MDGLGLVLGHVRNASTGFASVGDDTSGESVFLFWDCLDVENLLAYLGVVPEFVDEGLGPVASLDRALQVLGEVPSDVRPSGVRDALCAVRARAAGA